MAAKTVFWCHVCDHNQVHSNDTKTGKFYQVFGHQYLPAMKVVNGKYEMQPQGSGDYHSIVFAVCNECNLLDSLREINLED
jgi:hypothetical protein